MRITHLLLSLGMVLAPWAQTFAAETPQPATEFQPPADSKTWVKLDVPYVPTPYVVVEAMLELAEPKPDDVLYDLGSGDGRIVIAAVRDHGVKKAVGIDLNPLRIQEANANAAAGKFTDRARFIECDIFKVNFSDASIVTMYLMPHVNARLRPQLLDLKPGTRIVSHAFDMFDWTPDQHTIVNGSDVFFWIIPAKAAGTWQWRSGNDAFSLVLAQKYQMVSGTLKAFGQEAEITNGRLKGEALTFDAQIKRGNAVVPVSFNGTVSGGAILGTITIDGVASGISAVPAR